MIWERRAAGLAACATCFAYVGCGISVPAKIPDGTLFEGTTSPLSYAGPSARGLADARVHRQAHGEACQSSFVLPTSLSSQFLPTKLAAALIPYPTLGVAWGDNGYARALADARGNAGGGWLYDIRFDMHTTAILGIWVKECIEVHAEVGP